MAFLATIVYSIHPVIIIFGVTNLFIATILNPFPFTIRFLEILNFDMQHSFLALLSKIMFSGIQVSSLICNFF